MVPQKVKELSEANFGYNARDMLKMDVIVSTKVGRTALQSAARTASLLLTTDGKLRKIRNPRALGGGMC